MLKIRDSKFLMCVLFLAVNGILSHFWGEAIPRKWFAPNNSSLGCYKWEKNGSIYEKLHIRKWKDKLPDMSKICKSMFPKKINNSSKADDLLRLYQETCVAELVHNVLSALSLACIYIYPGKGGFLICLFWIVVGNLPFIIIQRYNRPKILKAYLKLCNHEYSKIKVNENENTDFDLQHR